MLIRIFHFQSHFVHDERRWIPAFAGMTILRSAVCQTSTRCKNGKRRLTHCISNDFTAQKWKAILRPPAFKTSARRGVRQGISNACVAPAETVWLACQTVARRGIQRLCFSYERCFSHSAKAGPVSACCKPISTDACKYPILDPQSKRLP